MREIKLENIALPSGWDLRARTAIDVGHDDIHKHSSVWQECKKPLKSLSYDKCYYCEIVQERSDNAVDHFRPKSLYPWSAFRLSNYRFACTYCNSRRCDIENGRVGGKGDEFPLLDEARRATCLEEEEDECPLLLDPCQPDEPGLIDFDESGQPSPTYSIDESETRHLRATISIRLYHLDHQDLVDRRMLLATKLVRIIRVAERLFPYTEIGQPAIDASFKEQLRTLAEAIKPEAELSSFARRILDGYRYNKWIPGLLRSV
jgi:uncharacterized protein (TIGR02646 family)